MAETESDNSIDLTLVNITDKIKQADKTARDMYNRLDLFMKESAKKDKPTKTVQPGQRATEKQPESDNKSKLPDTKDTEIDDLKNNVVAEITNELNETNTQLESLKEQEDSNTQTVLNAVDDADKNKAPVVEEKTKQPSTPVEEKSPNIEKKQEEIVEDTKPVDVKVVVEPGKQKESSSTPEPAQPFKEQDLKNDNNKIVEKETIKIVERPEEPKELSKEQLTTSTEQSKEQLDIITDIPKPLDTETTDDFKIAETILPEREAPIAKDPDIISNPQPTQLNVATTKEEEIAKDVTVSEQEIMNNVVESNVPPQQEQKATIPDVVEDRQEPFTAAPEILPREIPDVVAGSEEKKVPALNASDESLLAISKSIDSISQSMRQNQDKLISSITSLNNTAAEILRLLPTLQSQRQPGENANDIRPAGKKRGVDTGNMIGNFRESLNITTRGYSRNTVFPGNNSIS